MMDSQWNGWKIVLASASPRRQELLAQLGIAPQIKPSGLEEASEETEPERLVMDLSRKKAEDAAQSCAPGEMVIGADTVVAVDGQILGKPGNEERACEMISMLAGREHQVYTGVTVILCLGEGRFCGSTFAERTDVSVYPMTGEEIGEYARSGEPLDKAGGYGIQGRFAAYIRGIRGDYANVVGLPLGRLYQEMKNLTKENAEHD